MDEAMATGYPIVAAAHDGGARAGEASGDLRESHDLGRRTEVRAAPGDRLRDMRRRHVGVGRGTVDPALDGLEDMRGAVLLEQLVVQAAGLVARVRDELDEDLAHRVGRRGLGGDAGHDVDHDDERSVWQAACRARSARHHDAPAPRCQAPARHAACAAAGRGKCGRGGAKSGPLRRHLRTLWRNLKERGR